MGRRGCESQFDTLSSRRKDEVPQCSIIVGSVVFDVRNEGIWEDDEGLEASSNGGANMGKYLIYHLSFIKSFSKNCIIIEDIHIWLKNFISHLKKKNVKIHERNFWNTYVYFERCFNWHMFVFFRINFL